MRLFTYSGRCRGLSSLLSLTSVVAGNRHLVTDSGRLCVRKLWREVISRQSCLWVATSVPLMHRPESGCGRAWSFLAVKRQASIAALCKKVSRYLNKYWFNWKLSLSSFAVLMRTSTKCCKKNVQNAASLPHKTCYSRCHKIGYFFVFKSSKCDSTGSLQRSPVPLAIRRRGEGARLVPTFQTPRFSGFWASLHILSHHLTRSCPGVPNNNMTPNDIRAYQTTNFVWIHQWKL